MSRRQGRMLAMALTVCLTLCHSMHAFAAGPEIETEQPGGNLPEPPLPEPELPEIRPEEPGVPETATPSNLPEPQIDEEPVLPEDMTRICGTMDEFLAELEKDIGGAISFSGEGPFVLARDEEIAVTQPVTVYLPPCGLEVGEWLSLSIDGPVTFTGTRGFTVPDYAGLYLSGGVAIRINEGSGQEAPAAVILHGLGRLFADSDVILRAEGDNAAAICCTGKNTLDLGYAQVSAAGRNAAGIFSSGDLFVRQAFVQSEGDDSCAIRGTNQVCLFQVTATGAVLADSGYWVFSNFSQPPQNFVELIPESEDMFMQTVVYQNLACGSPAVEFPDQITHYNKYYWPNDDEVPFYVDVECFTAWDYDGLDYAVPGIYNAEAALQPVIPDSVLSVRSYKHQITVMEQHRAALYKSDSCAPEYYGAGQYVAVFLLAPIRDAQRILFWVYEEEDGWRELTSAGDAIYAEKWSSDLHPSFEFWGEVPFFQVSGLEEDSSYWVTAQVIGGPMEGFSNLWKLETGSQKGGDRTGTDRGGAMPATLPDSQGSSGGDNSSSEHGGITTGNGGKTYQSGNIPYGEDHAASGEPDKDIQPPDTNQTSHTEVKWEALPDFEPVPAAAPVQSAKADNEPETIEKTLTDNAAEKETSRAEIAQTLKPDEPLPLDPEQSAPEPEYPVNTLTVFFISTAVLGGGALLLLRFGRPERWRHGRT